MVVVTQHVLKYVGTELVISSRYLGANMNSKNNVSTKNRKRIKAGNRVYFSLVNLAEIRLFSR